MKLLLVANGYPPTAYGGVEIYVSSIATELLSKGHTVAVFCREANEHLPDGHVLTEQNGGLRIIRVVNDYKTISSIVETYLDSNIKRIFAEWLQTEAPDMIHFNHWIALSADLPSIAVRAGIPSVATLHDYWAICQRVHLLDWQGRRCLGPMQGGDCFQCVLKHGFQRQWLRIPFQVLKRFFKGSGKAKVKQLLKWRSDSSGFLSGTRLDFVERAEVFHDNLGLCKSILAPSEFVRNIFRANGYEDSDIRVLPLGIDSVPQSDPKTCIPGKLRIAFIGTFTPGKGAHILVTAMQDIPEEDLELKLYGRADVNPVYANRLLRRIENDARISYAGAFTPQQKGEIYEDIDILVVPSLVDESFSIVARDALARGIPVIASDAGALSEIIEDGVNGFLFQPGDHLSLAEYLRDFARNPVMLHQLRAPGSLNIISIQEHVQHLLAVYERILDK